MMEKRPEGISRLAWAYTRCGRPLIPNWHEKVDEIFKKHGVVKGDPKKFGVRIYMPLGFLDEESVLDVELPEETEEKP